MWFKYVVIIVFAIEALVSLLAWRGKKLKEETPVGYLLAGLSYIVLIIGAVILIK
jgi:hypothetical protein